MAACWMLIWLHGGSRGSELWLLGAWRGPGVVPFFLHVTILFAVLALAHFGHVSLLVALSTRHCHWCCGFLFAALFVVFPIAFYLPYSFAFPIC